MQAEELFSYYQQSAGINTDTRNLLEGELYFALKGPSFNGNQFAEKALINGASWAIIDEPDAKINDRCLLVPNVLEALQQLATYYRKELSLPVIAITGSNGKTTTKELLTRVLRQKYKTFATVGNYNNHIGVPLTILAMPPDTEILLLELGDNQQGDVEELCRIAQPDYGIITNIGKDHIAGFGSFDNNIKAKKELFDYLLAYKGKAFVHSQDKLLMELAEPFKGTDTPDPIFYGGKNDFSYLEYAGSDPYIRYKAGKREYQTRLIGRYNFENVQAAACFGRYFSVPENDIHQTISYYAPDNNRSQLMQTASNLLILDAYNANPSSMEAALRNFAELETELPKAVLLGEMLELGDIADAEHKSIIDLAEELNFNEKFYIGGGFYKYRTDKGHFFKEAKELIDYLHQHPLTQHYVLLKGSRGGKLEQFKLHL